MTMVAYVEKARKTSLSIMCTTSAIFIKIYKWGEKVNKHTNIKHKSK